MTLDEFLDELSKTTGPWRVMADGSIRCARGACPINAVMYQRDRTHESLESFVFAREGLGLTETVARDIANAADSRRCKKVRARLLASLGLTEPR